MMAVGSTRRHRRGGTTASSRCAAGPPRSTRASAWRASSVQAQSFTSRFRSTPAAVMPAETERIRVLVVDDQPVVRRGLVAFLESEPDLDLVGDADGYVQALSL